MARVEEGSQGLNAYKVVVAVIVVVVIVVVVVAILGGYGCSTRSRIHKYTHVI